MIKILSTAALLIFLVFLISFFAGSETAFLSMTGIRIRQMLRQRKRGAKKVAALRNDMDGLLTVILIGINFLNTLASAIATALAVQLVGNKGLGIATVVTTFFVTVFGEIVPKTGAALNPEKTAVQNAVPLMLLKKIFFPVVWIFSKVSKGTAFIVEKIWRTDDTLITEEELTTLIGEGANDGTIDKSEENMLNGLIKISDIHVHDIMKHHSLVSFIEKKSSREEILDMFRSSGFSHLPVTDGNDKNVIGIVYYKDILFSAGDSAQFTAERFMKTPLFVPETFSVFELVHVFKKENRSFAVALDEQGSTAGVVTMDDALRAVFGRMSIDANDSSAPEQRIKIISPKEFLVPGDIHLSDLNSFLHINLDSEEYNTLAGWMMEKLDSVPSAGEAINYNGKVFVIEDKSLRRIVTVRIKDKF